jgi:hypothetical protein
MNHPAYEVRNAALQHKQIGSTDFRIRTWFDHTRNTMVVEVVTAETDNESSVRARSAASSQ